MNVLLSFLYRVNGTIKRLIGRTTWANRLQTFKCRVILPLAFRLLERRYKIDTEGRVNLEDLGIDPSNRVYYVPSGWLTMQYISSVISLTKDDVFVDFGSGKGRMVFLAARYPLKRIVGIEISEQLNAAARENVTRNAKKLRCKNIELITSDVLQFQIPSDMTIAYFFNPFKGEIFKQVLENIQSSYQKCPRNMWVVYMGVPNDYLEHCGWLYRVSCKGNIYFYKPLQQ